MKLIEIVTASLVTMKVTNVLQWNWAMVLAPLAMALLWVFFTAVFRIMEDGNV